MYDLNRVHYYNDEVVKVLQSAVGVPGVGVEMVAKQVYELLMKKWADTPEPLQSTPTRDFEIVAVLNFIRHPYLSWEEKIERIVGTADKRYADGIMAQSLRYYETLMS